MPRLPWRRTSAVRLNVVVSAFNVPATPVTVYAIGEMEDVDIHVTENDWKPCTAELGKCLHCQNEVRRRVYGYFAALVKCRDKDGSVTLFPHVIAVPEMSRRDFPPVLFGQVMELKRLKGNKKVDATIQRSILMPAGVENLIDARQVLEHRWFKGREDIPPVEIPRQQLDQVIAAINAAEAPRKPQGKAEASGLGGGVNVFEFMEEAKLMEKVRDGIPAAKREAERRGLTPAIAAQVEEFEDHKAHGTRPGEIAGTLRVDRDGPGLKVFLEPPPAGPLQVEADPEVETLEEILGASFPRKNRGAA